MESIRRDAVLQVKVTEPQRERYREAARAAGLPYPDWVRRVLDAAAEATIDQARKEAERGRRSARARA